MASRDFALEAGRLVQGRPDEIGVPWTELTDTGGVFADAEHRDHLHFGWEPRSFGIESRGLPALLRHSGTSRAPVVGQTFLLLLTNVLERAT